jgi:hypothetical protein
VIDIWRKPTSQVLFVAWHSGEGPLAQWAAVGRLEHTPRGYRFVYMQGARKLRDFGPFPGMSDVEAVRIGGIISVLRKPVAGTFAS